MAGKRTLRPTRRLFHSTQTVPAGRELFAVECIFGAAKKDFSDAPSKMNMAGRMFQAESVRDTDFIHSLMISILLSSYPDLKRYQEKSVF
jgi:hypothetical protein